ncbi:hypothetical protein GM3708_2876 [Geminocystis sp. NIES-3708]|uniref:PEP-CTERM sorting domain-containing protein n=1 Tax=Geminocystis sp. NIES-3708 TaxID=1615909 RepID=UPI0005FCB769|nr:PEP-CTERM sorting domain-containing protein [Geminocystis sp. NIES-3708]BAQ62470.1 hypothetical protein GM3708_2876 [Geminocystis sp. NIES-3708]
MNLVKILSQSVFFITGATIFTMATTGTAQAIVLTFEGLQDLESVNNFYDGGFGGNGSGPGPDYDITFSSNSLAIIDGDAGGSGNFGGEPSPDTVLFFLDGPAAIMNVANGFTTGFSFYYSAINNPGFINVYDDLNGTGNLLATLNLPLTPFDGAPDPTGQFSPLLPLGVAFNGTAKSVDFGGTVNQIAFDNITLGSDIPDPTDVPEPLTILGTVSAGIMGTLMKKKRKQKA